jgi:glycosyltransferase involved in cell wall biosynthesis
MIRVPPESVWRKSEVPRALFVTPNAFNHLTGGGITFSNLFKGWPADRLATIHNDSVPTSDDVCSHYFVLGSQEIDLIAPFRIVRGFRDRESKSQTVSIPTTTTMQSASRGLIARVQGDSAPWRGRLTARLTRWIEGFRPELVYTILGSNAHMDLAMAIRQRFALPEVVHFMDDYPSANYRRGLFAPFERARMRRILARHLRSATTRMGICSEMCTAYAKRYGRSFVPFQNCVDVERWQPVVRRDSAVSGPGYRLLYFGSVLTNAQFASLSDVCNSVASLSRGGMRIEFQIVTPDSRDDGRRRSLERHPSIKVVAATENDQEFFSTLAAADALVLPVNFDEHTIAYIRYSMPTKVPAYMASGTPVLVYGPRGVAQVDYAARESWGHVVSKRDPDALDAGLRRILTDTALRESLRMRAQEVAKANHDSTLVRARFQEALKKAAWEKA